MGSASCSSPFRVEGEGRNNAALALRSFGDARSSCRDVCRSQMPERPPPHPLLSISLLLALRAQPVSGGLTTESWIPRRATRYRNTLILLLLLLHASLDNSRNGNLCALPFPLTLFSCLLLLSQRRPSGNSRISGPICKSIQEVRAGGFRRRPRNEGLAHDPRRFCLLTCLSPSGRAPQALGNAFRMPRCAAKVRRCSACSRAVHPGSAAWSTWLARGTVRRRAPLVTATNCMLDVHRAEKDVSELCTHVWLPAFLYNFI